MYSVLKTKFYNWTIALGCKLFLLPILYAPAMILLISIHPTLFFFLHRAYTKELKLGDTLDRVQGHTTTDNLETPIILQHITVDCRRKLRWSRIHMWNNTILMRQISKTEGRRKSHEEQVGDQKSQNTQYA